MSQNVYKIIADPTELLRWCNKISELYTPFPKNACMLGWLSSRKKYDKNAAHDMNCFERRIFYNLDYEYMHRDIKKWEVEYGIYCDKYGTSVTQQSLACYLMINPRDCMKSSLDLCNKILINFQNGYQDNDNCQDFKHTLHWYKTLLHKNKLKDH
eukprot:30988_1